MGLAVKAIERIFKRLSATYGASWDRSLGAAPLADVKTAWSHELSGFENRLEDVAWALDNLPEKCPNVIEFKKLCRAAPLTEAPRLEAPKADPERLKEELSKLGHIVKAPRPGDKDWARVILKAHESGEKVSPIRLRFAREALR